MELEAETGKTNGKSAPAMADHPEMEEVTALTMALGEATRAKTKMNADNMETKPKETREGSVLMPADKDSAFIRTDSKKFLYYFEEFHHTSTHDRGARQKRTLFCVFWFFPTFMSCWYASAIFWNPSFEKDAPALLWTPGGTMSINGTLTACPKPSLCSEGIVEVLCLVNSRLTAFAMYVSMFLTFSTKCHATIRFLSGTFVAELVPLQDLHKVHHRQGLLFACLAFSHTVTHLLRWLIRDDWVFLTEAAGLSGVVAMLLMFLVVGSMKSQRIRKKVSYEFRFNIHWFFVPLCIALCYHAKRTMVLTLIASLIWLADWLYMMVFHTYRLDLVEFTRLGDGGVQMLWMNPPGFEPHSGEYLKVQIPWLPKRGDEWHAFSLYKQEYTKEGLAVTERIKKQAVSKEKEALPPSETARVWRPNNAKGGHAIDTATTCLLLIEFQNEFASEGGKLHQGVRPVMQNTNMLEKVVNLAKVAREAGIKVFHAPIMFAAGGQEDNPNKNLGILKDIKNQGLFVEGTWNADFHEKMGPKFGDIVVRGKKGLDCFPGTNLQEHLVQHGIYTIILGGFLTDCCIESTMRTAYEKGFNTITLTDGCATTSLSAHLAATKGTFLKFSTPMTCEQASHAIKQFSSASALFSKDGDAPEREEQLMPVVETLGKMTAATGTRSDVDMEVRGGMATKEYETTQIFMVPVGDWTEEVSMAVLGEKRHRTCWVRGPYMSPYSVAKDFSQLLLFASGIGITPAFGIMGQYRGASRTKILVWVVRSVHMLRFFAPMFREAQIVYIYYTGKEKLSEAEIREIRQSSQVNTDRTLSGVFVFQRRPNLVEVMEDIIVSFEGYAEEGERVLVSEVDKHKRATWCALYCGGSFKIKDQLEKAAKRIGMGYEAELFDW